MKIPYLCLTVLSLLGLSHGAYSAQDARYVTAWYITPAALSITREVTVEESSAGTYFSVIGFKMGYFGLQDHFNGKKNFIFSVWDNYNAEPPDTVPNNRRVKVIAANPKVRVARFGHEGTGAQSFLDFNWKIGNTYKFNVTAMIVDENTIYTAQVFTPETGKWQMLASFKTITGGIALEHTYSFVEDFLRNGESAKQRRSAIFKDLGATLTTGEQYVTKHVFFNPTANHPLNSVNLTQLSDKRFRMATGGNTKPEIPFNSYVELLK